MVSMDGRFTQLLLDKIVVELYIKPVHGQKKKKPVFMEAVFGTT